VRIISNASGRQNLYSCVYENLFGNGKGATGTTGFFRNPVSFMALREFRLIMGVYWEPNPKPPINFR
jgi:hypothetical protein